MENNFDKHIKDSLENLGEDYTPGSWELLHQKMMSEPTLDGHSIEDNSFDQNIREKLNQVEANFNPNHWDAMASQLDHLSDQSNVEDLEFDGLLFEHLNDLRIPFSQAHWTLMSNRLDEEFSIRRKLYRYKVVEVALMLLALFTLFQYLPLHEKAKIVFQQKASQIQQIETQQLIPSLPAPNQDESEAGHQEVTTPPQSTHKKISQKTALVESPIVPNKASNSVESSPVQSSQSIQEFTALAEVNELQAADHKGGRLFENQTQSALSPLALSHLDIPLLESKEQSNYRSRVQQMATSPSTSSSPDLLDAEDFSLASLPMGPIHLKRYLSNSCTFCQFKRSVQVRVGMFISSDFNEIMTPEKVYPNFIDAPYQQVTSGYGGGISLGFRHKKWEFETGLAYAHLSYEPNQTIITTGSFIRSSIQTKVFDAAFLNIIKVPLHLNYTFDRNSKWHFYAVGGASINILALNHFNHSTSAVGIGAPPPAVSPREKEPTYDGVFEGGDFRVNSYYTANVGMGVERNLTSRWSIFMQPVYQHMFYRKGFGPNNDRFNTLSIQFGAKSTFR
ncbi:MAG: hypothetical protein AAF985_11725 [Bacteroidota bacterium]